LRRASAGICTVILLTVAASRLYLDFHWLSDVAGGFAIGLAYLLALIVVLETMPVRTLATATLSAKRESPVRPSSRSSA
jgi:membrane-associated phospholipid phosphatase